MKKVLETIVSGIAIGIIALVVLIGGAILVNENIVKLPFLGQTAVAVEENRGNAPSKPNDSNESGSKSTERKQTSSEQASYAYQDIVELVEDAMPSVVSVTNIQKYIQNGYSFWGFRQEAREVEVPASGSGVIVGVTDQEVIILTNNHVVSNATSLSVTFNDGGEAIESQIKGIDAEKDLAVISVMKDKIPSEVVTNIHAITLADSNNIRVGEKVVAIGNALGIGQSVTTGIVSAKDRIVDGINDTQPLIQTDAAINPGNSGGALLNMRGELIGINVAKSAGNAIEGMGYAIPINSAKEVVDTMSSKKPRETIPENEQGYLGIIARNIDSQTAQSFDMPEGIFVYEIAEGGPAVNTELKAKDIIVAFDDQNIKTLSELQDLLKYTRGGDVVNIKVKRIESGSYVDKEFKFTLGTRSQENVSTKSNAKKANQSQGNSGNSGNYDGFDNFGFEDFFRQFGGNSFGW